MLMQYYFRSYENYRNNVTSRLLPVQLGIYLRMNSIFSEYARDRSNMWTATVTGFSTHDSDCGGRPRHRQIMPCSARGWILQNSSSSRRHSSPPASITIPTQSRQCASNIRVPALLRMYMVYPTIHLQHPSRCRIVSNYWFCNMHYYCSGISPICAIYFGIIHIVPEKTY